LGNTYRKILIRLIKRTDLFDSTYYLETQGDILRSGISPLHHYATYGDREKRSPMIFFDPGYYNSQTKGHAKKVNTLLHYAHIGRFRRISPSPWININYYLSCNKDVARAGFDPLLHFWKWGGSEGRCPSPEFDSSYYLRTNPSVKQSRINPLLHYLRIGRFEGLRTFPEDGFDALGAEANDLRHACIPDDKTWSNLKCRKGTEDTSVDVIIPVYKGKIETILCLYSVLSASCATDFELIVINDSSPDSELVETLHHLADKGLFTLLENPKNSGFVHTANRGMSLHQMRDVVLLNSDTEVFEGWLDRLQCAAKRHPRTGTVTPLSNNATICSYPRFLQDNPFPLELDFAELDSLTATVNAGIEVEAPTGVGFCMYIKRAVLDEIGTFDEKKFGRGYGEENDFCQRAIHKGWHNIIAADIFVHHWGSTSFQGETSKRVQVALKTLDRLHPGYQQYVSSFIAKDPLSDARQHLDMERLIRLQQKENVLIVCHNRGGGAERHVQEDIQRLSTEGYGVYLMRPVPGQLSHVFIKHSAATQLPNLPPYSLAETTDLQKLLKKLNITEIHTHSLVDFIPDSPDHLISLVKAMDVRLEINLHDYKVICPRINLADNNGFYCGEPSDTICNKCLAKHGSDFRASDIRAWRTMHRRVLLAAHQVLVPDQDVSLRLKNYFPEVTFDVSPHEDLFLPETKPKNPTLRKGEKLRIVIIGAIGKIKGFEILLACARDSRQRKLPLEFILMGYSMNDRMLQDAGVTISGRYLEENAQKTLEALSPHLVWLPSIWPETYSYTLSIALQAKLPIAAFDIGAIARRLQEHGLDNGLLPLATAFEPDTINDSFLRKLSNSHQETVAICND
jgi:GT2 family glycosyltransferase/glycosyltransferase involved in cell wall biosynthesis